MIILNFIRGFCMALADSVPGVSGGTIAFILGFYDDFINSLNTLVSKDPWEEKKKALIYNYLNCISKLKIYIISLTSSSSFQEVIFSNPAIFDGSNTGSFIPDFFCFS